MALEYRLSYTADEIKEKLAKIDFLATEDYVDEAIAAIDLPTGGGGGEATADLLASGTIDVDFVGNINTGITWAQLKEYDELIITYRQVDGAADELFLKLQPEGGDIWYSGNRIFRGGSDLKYGVINYKALNSSKTLFDVSMANVKWIASATENIIETNAQDVSTTSGVSNSLYGERYKKLKLVFTEEQTAKYTLQFCFRDAVTKAKTFGVWGVKY